jgi:hypothetical protein
MRRLESWLGAILAAASTACAADEACDEGSMSSESQALTGSRVFSSSGEREVLPLALALAGLPELWPPEGAIEASTLTVHLGLSYGAVPADGSVQMPSIVVSLDDAPLGASGPYPAASGVTVQGSPITTCAGPAEHGCCAFGTRACNVGATLVIERVEGEPFPPLGVTWEIRASASVNECPLRESNPTLGLELVEP